MSFTVTKLVRFPTKARGCSPNRLDPFLGPPSLLFIGKGKGKIHPRTGREGPLGSRGIALNLGSRLGWVVNTVPQLFNPGKETQFPLYRSGSATGPGKWL